MGLFSFLFKDHRRSQDYDYEEEEWEKTSLLQPFSSPDPSEDVSDATMMIPQVRKLHVSPDAPASKKKAPQPEAAASVDEANDEMDDLMNAISSAVQRKTAKPSRPMAGTQSMLSNVASAVDERESALDDDATAVLPRAHATTGDATVVVKHSEPIVTTDTMGDVTRVVFPSSSAVSQSAEPEEADTLAATAVLIKKPEAEASEETATEEPITVSEGPEVATENTEAPIEEEPAVEDTATEEDIPAPDVSEAVSPSAADAADETAETEEPTAEAVVEDTADVTEDEAESPAEVSAVEEETPLEETAIEEVANEATSEDATSEEVPEAEESPVEAVAVEEAAPEMVAEETALDSDALVPEDPQVDTVAAEEASVTEAASEVVPPVAPAVEVFSAERLTPNPLVSQVLSSVAGSAAPVTEAPPIDEPSEEAVAGQPAAPTASIVLPDSDEDDEEPAWGEHWVSPDAAMLSDSDEYFRLTWKLKGTGKKRRLRAISECVKGQPVYITCAPDDSECVVITEDGEEIGRLTEQDSMVYHTLVSGHPHNMYIKKIRSSQFEKTKVKILVIVHRGSSNAAENGIISDS